VRELAPTARWQTAPAAVARRVVEDGQEDAAEDEAVLVSAAGLGQQRRQLRSHWRHVAVLPIRMLEPREKK
jgi:hypothetical protein